MKVLQLIDTLNAGGAERVAVNYANALVGKLEGSFLCTTRKEGVLKSELNPKVGYLFLKKRSALDLAAVFRLKNFVKKYRVDIIHAHATSFFTAVLVKILYPKIKLVWHDHYGNSEKLNQRPRLILRLCKYYFDQVLAVSRDLEKWIKLNLKQEKVVFFPNFSIPQTKNRQTCLKAPETYKIVCVANLRAQKNQLLLLDAFQNLAHLKNTISLHLFGQCVEENYANKVLEQIKELTAQQWTIYFYGSVPDIAHVLSQANLAVLPSDSEGFPLTLVEYGQAGLPVIATRVGSCEEIIGDPQCGILIPPGDRIALTNALSLLLNHPEKAKIMGKRFQERVMKHYHPEALLNQLLQCYKAL